MDARKLKKFREKLEEKKDSLVNAVQRNEAYGREANVEVETMDSGDKASSSYTKEFVFSRSNNDRLVLKMIEEAMERMDEGSFGDCINCGKPVEAKRLEAVPWARYCIACQELDEQGMLSTE
ncbi:MAG TPA: TraR/DksA family transcriptional regulator [Acidobacteriota bacterium]|jgi:DnaK suppressor protein|nr:TraR/DksA family transcriptional regulator [Acidobacteriota bacterium]